MSMSKSGRRALFIIVATLANIVLIFAITIALIALYSVTLGRVLKAESSAFAVLVCIILSFVLSIVIYTKILNAIQKRPDLVEKWALNKESKRD